MQKRVAAVQKDVTTRVNGVQKTATDTQALRKQAQARRAAVEARVAELQAEAKAYPAKVSTQVSALVDENVAAANATASQAQ